MSYFTCRSKVIPSYEDTEVQILLVLPFLNLVSQFLLVILNMETLTYTIINYSLITVQIASNILLNNFSVQVYSMRTNIFIEIKSSLNTSNLTKNNTSLRSMLLNNIYLQHLETVL